MCMWTYSGIVIFQEQYEGEMLYLVLGIVAGGDQEVSQDQQLVICKMLLMLLPVVMVSPSKVW